MGFIEEKQNHHSDKPGRIALEQASSMTNLLSESSRIQLLKTLFALNLRR